MEWWPADSTKRKKELVCARGQKNRQQKIAWAFDIQGCEGRDQDLATERARARERERERKREREREREREKERVGSMLVARPEVRPVAHAGLSCPPAAAARRARRRGGGRAGWLPPAALRTEWACEARLWPPAGGSGPPTGPERRRNWTLWRRRGNRLRRRRNRLRMPQCIARTVQSAAAGTRLRRKRASRRASAQCREARESEGSAPHCRRSRDGGTAAFEHNGIQQ